MSEFQSQPPRARGTAPLDGFTSTSGPLVAPQTDQILRRGVLESEVRHGDRVISTMRPRVRVLERAIAAIGMPEQEQLALFAGVTDQEQLYTLEISVQFIDDPDLSRKAQVLVRQFAVAEEALQEARMALAQFEAARLEVGRVEGFSLNKFRGSLYPLYNFSVAFAGRPILGQMFPPMKKPSLTQPLPPLSAVQPPAEADGIDRLSRVVKEGALEPLMDRGTDFLRRAQEAKERGSGLLKKAQDMAPGFLSKFGGALKRPTQDP